MKRILALVFVVAMCFGLVACNNTPATPTTAATSTPETQTGPGPSTDPVTMIISRPVDSENLDPVLQDGNINLWVYTLCLEPLLLATDDGQDVQSGLAETWDVSADGLTYTFHMYKDLKFSDGTPVTAEDYVWTIERIMHTEESPWTSFYANWESVTCPDDQTVVIKTKTPSAVDLPTFSLFACVVTSKAHFDKVGGEEYSKGPVGTGPFMFKEWKQGEYMLLAKNPNYRFADSVKADEIKFTVVPDDNTRIMQLQAGEADIMTFVPYNRMEEINNTDGLMSTVIKGTGVTGLALNTTREPMDKVEVRQALAMAINKDEIVKNVHYGNTVAATSFLPPSVPYSADGKIDVMKFDVEGAKQKLSDAGYPDGFKLTITINAGNTNQEQISTIVKEQWSKIGVDLTIDVLEAAAMRALRNELKLDVFFGGWTSDVPDPSQQTRYWCINEVTQCIFTGWKNTQAEELALKAENEMDKAKREDLYKQIQQIHATDSPLIPIYYEGYPVAMSDKVSGFGQIPLGNYRFDNLTKAQ